MLNFVRQNRRKDGCYAGAKIWRAAWRECCGITPSSPETRPEENDSLKARLNVNHTGLGKPDKPRRARCGGGSLTVKKGEGLAGRGRWRKRMPRCNGADRATTRVVEIPTLKEGRLPAGLDGRETHGADLPKEMLDDGQIH